MHIIVTDDESWEYYEEKTKYSDFNIILPVLFNLYHGLELLMKGLIRLYGEVTDNNHNFDYLLRRLMCLDKEQDNLIDVLKKYIKTPIQIRFLEKYRRSQKISSINSLYQSFRYPVESTGKKAYNYFVIKYQEADLLPDLKEVINDIDIIIRGVVKRYHEL